MAIYPISQNDQVTILNDSDEDAETDSESDDDEADNLCMYEPEETSYTRFNITLCELYNASCYGPPSFESLHSHYLVLYRFKQYDTRVLNKIIRHYAATRTNYTHPTIRNYQHIKCKMVPEITECIYLPTGECICVKKTWWIRLIQRTWKKIYKLRQEIIRQRLHPRNLFYRGITGSWPSECKYSPSIRGMLSALSKI